LSTGRNYGLQYAKGEYITYPDDDDIIFDHHFEMLVNYLDRHPEVGLVKSRAEIFFPNETLGHNIMGCGYEGYGALWAMMHRRSDLKKVGYFNSRLKVAQDTDFILNFYNFCTKKQIQTLACITAQYTIHGKNMVITREQRLNEEMDYIFTKRLKKALKRQEMKKDYFITLLFMYYEHYQRYKKVFLKLAEIFFIQYPSVGSAYSLSLAYYGIRKISKAIGFAHRATSIQIKKQNEKEFIYYRRLKGFAFALLGKLYAHKRKYGQAIKYFLSGLNFIPNNFMLKLELFHAYLDSGKEGLALEIYKKISNRISESYLKGVICLYKKDYLNAEKNFNKIRAIDKSIEYRLCSSLGKLYYHTNRKNKAEKYLARAWTLEKSTYFYVLYNRKIFSLQKNKRCFDKFLEKVNFGLPFMSIVKGLVGRRKRIH
jgi:tetratricopeptide (TPR) repeat protein